MPRNLNQPLKPWGFHPGGFPPCHHHTSSELGPPTSTVVRRASTNSVKYLAVCVQRCLETNFRFWGGGDSWRPYGWGFRNPTFSSWAWVLNLYHYFLQGFLHHPAPVEVGSLYHLHGFIKYIPSGGAGFLPSTVSPKISGKGNPTPKQPKIRYSTSILGTWNCWWPWSV